MGIYEPVLVMSLSAILIVAVVYRSFIQEGIAFNGISVRPTMLTNRLNLTAGFLVYFFIIMISFMVITYYWGPLSAIVAPFVKDTPIEPLIGDGAKTPDALVPLVVAGAASWFLAWDVKYNPFAVMLQLARDLIHLPDQAQVTLAQLRAAKFRQLSEDEAESISRDEDISHCEAGDFALVRKSLLYRWAHLCHLRYLLLQYLRPGQRVAQRVRGAEVISSLGWDALDVSYRALSHQVATWRTSNTKDPDDAIEIFNQINDLKEKHYRILACLIASTSGSESEIWSRLQGLSDDPKPIPGNIPLYLTAFCANIFASILLGREASIFLYLKFIGPSTHISNLDIERLKFWFLVAFIIFFTPMFLMLVCRLALRKWLPFNEGRYWAFYGAFAVLAFAIAVLVLPELPYTTPAPKWLSDAYWKGVWSGYLWGLPPAFLTGMAAYRMDTRASSKDPPREVYWDRARVAVTCALVCGLFAFLAAMGAVRLSPEERYVAIATVVLLAGTTGWLSRFKT